VPAQKSLRRDQRTVAARGRQQTTGHSHQRAVTRSQLRTFDLPTQDLELMAQHEKLDVLDVNVPAAADQQLQQRHEGEVGERREHHAILPGPARDKPATEPDQRVGTLHAVTIRSWEGIEVHSHPAAHVERGVRSGDVGRVGRQRDRAGAHLSRRRARGCAPLHPPRLAARGGRPSRVQTTPCTTSPASSPQLRRRQDPVGRRGIERGAEAPRLR
jgi:hypothetical protein